MKKSSISFSLVFPALLIMLSSCIYSQNHISVRGSGRVSDREFNVSGFNAIDVSGGFDVILVQGNVESVTLSAEENLFDYITVKVENGTLKIFTRNNIRTTRQMRARVYFKDLNDLKVSGGGDVTSETIINAETLDINISGGGDFRSGINSDELKFRITGGGDADIEGKTKDYYLDISGGGDLKSNVNAGVITCRVTGGGDLYLNDEAKTSKADIYINGGGDMDVKMDAEKIVCNISGGGDGLLRGKASDLEVTINGGGDLDASSFSTQITSFNANGGSDLRVNASQELSGKISGGGNIYYSGNPERLNIEARGGSKTLKE